MSAAWIAGLKRRTSKHRPRAYCENCTWSVTQGRELTVDRVGLLAREHARTRQHRTRFIVAHVTEYTPDGSEWEAGRQRLEQATAERTGATA